MAVCFRSTRDDSSVELIGVHVTVATFCVYVRMVMRGAAAVRGVWCVVVHAHLPQQ